MSLSLSCCFSWHRHHSSFYETFISACALLAWVGAANPVGAWDIVHQRLVAVFAYIAGMPFAVVAQASCNVVGAFDHPHAAYSPVELGFGRDLRLLESRLSIRHQPHSHYPAQAQAR